MLNLDFPILGIAEICLVHHVKFYLPYIVFIVLSRKFNIVYAH